MSVAIMLCAIAAFAAFLGFGFAAGRIFSNFNGTVALGCVTLFSTTTLALWQFNRTKKKEAEARIFSERAANYKQLIGVLRKAMHSTKGWVEVDHDELAKELSSVTYDMIIWGGQDTVRSLLDFSDMTAGDLGGMVRKTASLYAAIRKDLGHEDDAELSNDLVLQMITAEDRATVRRLLHGEAA
ncbi:hypothetical protein [Caulobacter endophyticus]|uniref:hypothetical protein n=1 Tax=Caulobacter endophyticus TaxID=2172652 RepID=UPI00240F3D98|nr:hypothetical protein [Caulobacter endophyticus]MDG2530377.1 hypothetical protein [Caulobacter endophyticus]